MQNTANACRRRAFRIPRTKCGARLTDSFATTAAAAAKATSAGSPPPLLCCVRRHFDVGEAVGTVFLPVDRFGRHTLNGTTSLRPCSTASPHRIRFPDAAETRDMASSGVENFSSVPVKRGDFRPVESILAGQGNFRLLGTYNTVCNTFTQPSSFYAVV